MAPHGPARFATGGIGRPASLEILCGVIERLILALAVRGVLNGTDILEIAGITAPRAEDER